MTESVWNTTLAIFASLGGGGLIVVSLSSWLGKVWANRLMASDVHKHTQSIESLKSKLSQETERYKARLRNAEFLFLREYEAASALVAITAELEARHADPWMDDPDAFYATIEGHLETLDSDLALYLIRHAACLPDDARNQLVQAKNCATRGTFGDVAGGQTPRELAEECYRKLKSAEAVLLGRMTSRASQHDEPVNR